LNIIHTVPSIALKHGGPPRSVTQLCANFKDFNQPVRLFSYDHKGQENIQVPDTVHLNLIPTNKKLTQDISSLEDLKNESLIHHHGIWLKCAHDVIQFSQKQNIPLVLSPRGMLEPWALRHNAFKKKVAWMLYQKNDLKKVKGFHATALSEAQQIRKLGYKQPIGIIPNGVYLPHIHELHSLEYKGSSSNKKVLFLSRLHEKKGLDILLKAWKRLSPSNAILEITGNDDGGYKSKLIKLRKELGLDGNQVIITEPKYGDEKNKALKEADLFVLPSYSENFGIVVAEALSYGIPVITTKGCPWQDLEEYNCGWWTEPNLEDFTNALSQALSLPKYELYKFGQKGRELVENKYDWKSVASQMLEFYNYLLYDEKKPNFVF
jgi:glycosyltransferase involved in cell wall biosynthesis